MIDARGWSVWTGSAIRCVFQRRYGVVEELGSD